MSGVWNAKKGACELNLCREDYRCFAELIKKCRDSAGLQQNQQARGCVLNSCSTPRAQGPEVFVCAPTSTLVLLQFSLLLNVAHSFWASATTAIILSWMKPTLSQINYPGQLWAMPPSLFPSCHLHLTMRSKLLRGTWKLQESLCGDGKHFQGERTLRWSLSRECATERKHVWV